MVSSFESLDITARQVKCGEGGGNGSGAVTDAMEEQCNDVALSCGEQVADERTW